MLLLFGVSDQWIERAQTSMWKVIDIIVLDLGSVCRSGVASTFVLENTGCCPSDSSLQRISLRWTAAG